MFVFVKASVVKRGKVSEAAGVAEIKGAQPNLLNYIGDFYTERKFHLINKSFILSHTGEGYLLHVNNAPVNETYRFQFTAITAENSRSCLGAMSAKEKKRDNKIIKKIEETICPPESLPSVELKELENPQP